MPGEAATFPIVGVGASAGGVEALEAFFAGVPDQPGCAFVVITHLDPKRKSLLPEIIARYTAMPVREAEQAALVAPNEVHVLPADALLEIRQGRLQMTRNASPYRRERKPIDIFFSALAEDQGEYAVGVVLSGSDGDGTLGVRAIKERGGLTLAQIADGHPPLYPAMPDSAISSGMVDLAIPVPEMGQRLADYARNQTQLGRTTAGRGAGVRNVGKAREEICAILRSQVGHDFSGYKQPTFLRRVQRRLQLRQLQSLDDYLEVLRGDRNEVTALFRDLLISVSNFFRDPKAFEALETEVIPTLFARGGGVGAVRVWVPGCATGEEAYSIAILLREHMDRVPAAPQVQVFATDIDEAALTAARTARFPATALDGVSKARRERFFTAQDGAYQVAKDVRELCIFSAHSVIRDPPFSRLDLISCRNLLIYFGVDMQEQVVPTFHYALRPGGYLFLGASESVSQFSRLFVAIDKKHRVFRSRDDVTSRPRLPTFAPDAPPLVPTPREAARSRAETEHRRSIETHVLARYGPAHVVVNRDGEVVHYSPRTGKYLEPVAGAPSNHLLSMARKGLRLDLLAMLREAAETDRTVVRESANVELEDERTQPLTLTVEPIGEAGAERHYLVVFSDLGGPVARDGPSSPDDDGDTNVRHLEHELRETRERLQSLVEEYEVALEELKSSNEELVSVNEEQQSTNEELEASKEELQSLNEELQTVNAELHTKVELLDRANSDLTNVFESTRVATVFLDQDTVIRSFTPAISQIFNILPTDRGRPLTDLASRVELPSLGDDVRQVFSSGRTIERSIEHEGGKAHFLMRPVPYLDNDQTISGVVLTLVDITSLTLAEAQQKVLIEELNHRVKNMLMVVVSVAEQTYRTTKEPLAFKDRLLERIHAMAKSYELLSRERWTDASVQELVSPNIEPFGADRVRASGPELRLKPNQAISLGMVIHELATNAGKYGALSAPQGRLEIEWALDGDGEAIELTWRERDGPPVAEPTRRTGFGLRLVERETAVGLRGKAEVRFDPDGLSARLRFPK